MSIIKIKHEIGDKVSYNYCNGSKQSSGFVTTITIRQHGVIYGVTWDEDKIEKWSYDFELIPFSEKTTKITLEIKK